MRDRFICVPGCVEPIRTDYEGRRRTENSLDVDGEWSDEKHFDSPR